MPRTEVTMSDDLNKILLPRPEGDPLTDFPLGEHDHQGVETKPSLSFEGLWERITQSGLAEPVLRFSTHLLSVALILIVVWGMRNFYLQARDSEWTLSSALAASFSQEETIVEAELVAVPGDPKLPAFQVTPAQVPAVQRAAALYTEIPTRPRVDVITYTVVTGDSVFGIAEKFSIKPETILWSNPVLQDNPHRLQPDQVLNILPVNGTYHKWSAGEDLGKVAAYYQVEPLAIIEWPGNHFDLFDFNLQNPDIEPGTMLIIPGGQREFIDYGPPVIPRSNPAVARTYGPGYCGEVYEGLVGVGAFVWPTTERWLSGYDYNPAANHPALDFAGKIGNPIWAVDNGVVVYAGWSYSGYGNLVVIDHGNGWQSLYAHLNDYYVTCGMSVYQGGTIGALGSTGNSSGPHLHFELIYNTAKVNPWDFLP